LSQREQLVSHILDWFPVLDCPQETAFGILSPPLGSARLKAVEMVAALARLGSPDAEEALVRAELLPRCMALFVQYPFNNLLHHQVGVGV
jgi:serine/threonine-protein phosphatase 6 regulatory subunit 3